MSLRLRYGGVLGRGVATLVQEMHQYGHAADAIHECVMQLDDDRGALAVHSLDNHCLPWRKLWIEPDGGHHLGHVEHVPEGCAGRQSHAAKVEVEIEMIVRHELPPTAAQWTRNSTGPQPGYGLHERCHTTHDFCPTGGTVQRHHGDDGWSQHWISTDRPQ